MNCEKFRELMTGFLDGDLPMSLQTEAQEHLDSCALCQEEIALDTELVSLMRQMPRERAPQSLSASVLVRVDKEPGATRQGLFGWLAPPRNLRVLEAFAAVGVIAIGAFIYTHISNLSRERASSRKLETSLSLAQPDSRAELKSETPTHEPTLGTSSRGEILRQEETSGQKAGIAKKPAEAAQDTEGARVTTLGEPPHGPVQDTTEQARQLSPSGNLGLALDDRPQTHDQPKAPTLPPAAPPVETKAGVESSIAVGRPVPTPAPTVGKAPAAARAFSETAAPHTSLPESKGRDLFYSQPPPPSAPEPSLQENRIGAVATMDSLSAKSAAVGGMFTGGSAVANQQQVLINVIGGKSKTGPVLVQSLSDEVSRLFVANGGRVTAQQNSVGQAGAGFGVVNSALKDEQIAQAEVQGEVPSAAFGSFVADLESLDFLPVFVADKDATARQANASEMLREKPARKGQRVAGYFLLQQIDQATSLPVEKFAPASVNPPGYNLESEGRTARQTQETKAQEIPEASPMVQIQIQIRGVADANEARQFPK
ncbi:MAG: zf-HC2 domain-containing protein [bacterium]